MQVRHYVVLFDIDNTLMDFKACTRNKVVWIGSAALWQEYIEVLKKCLDTYKTKVHIGIATSKLKYYKDGINIRNGDVLSAAVLEDDVFLLNVNVRADGIGRNLGLKRFLNPDLIFFTSGQCKVVNAMNHVKDILQKQLQLQDILLDKSNIMLIDDYRVQCESAIANGFQSICVESLVEADQTNREAQVGSIFLKIFEIFNLPIPLIMLAAVGVIEEKNNEDEIICEVEDELINYMSASEEIGINTLKQMSHLKKRKFETINTPGAATLPQPQGFFTVKKRKVCNGNAEQPEYYVFRI